MNLNESPRIVGINAVTEEIRSIGPESLEERCVYHRGFEFRTHTLENGTVLTLAQKDGEPARVWIKVPGDNGQFTYLDCPSTDVEKFATIFDSTGHWTSKPSEGK